MAETVPASVSAAVPASAERAAADLVAAAFDNPQIPQARKAGDEAEPVAEVEAEVEPVAEPEPEVTAEVEAEQAEAPAAEAEPEAEVPVVEAEAEAAADVVDDAGTAEDEAPAEPVAEIAPAAEDVEAEPEPEAAPAAEVAEEAPVAAEAEAETPAEPEADEPAAELEAVTEPEPEPAPEPEAVSEPEPVVAEVTPEPEPAPVQEAPEAEPEPEPQAETEPQPATEPETPAEAPAPAPAPEPVAAAAEAPAEPEAEPEAPASDEASGAAPAVPLARVKAAAPHLVDAYKAAGTVLGKQGLAGARAAVYLVVDRSGSMRPYFKDGSVQRLAEQTVALAAHLNEDAAVTAVFFSTDIDGTAELTPAELTPTRVEEINATLGRLGRTNYHRAVEEVLALHDKSADPSLPALVVFQTDGAPDAKTPATQALTEAAERPERAFHWRFTVWGEEEAKAFDYLRKLATPRTGVHFAGTTPAETAHAEFYRGLLADWSL
ncbi:VWA domain-containing protein [Streptomyces sp. NPDC048623]|uniref:VWA domain-containing protein n=1 Tax=Streptomyces sp. NPDC048623 TaxID=3155761 RepID=UPI003420AC29